MSCNNDIQTFSVSGSQLTRFPKNREEITVEHMPNAVRLTLIFNNERMSSLLTPADARALADLLIQQGAPS
jgi:hypothetical protein